MQLHERLSPGHSGGDPLLDACHAAGARHEDPSGLFVAREQGARDAAAGRSLDGRRDERGEESADQWRVRDDDDQGTPPTLDADAPTPATAASPASCVTKVSTAAAPGSSSARRARRPIDEPSARPSASTASGGADRATSSSAAMGTRRTRSSSLPVRTLPCRKIEADSVRRIERGDVHSFHFQAYTGRANKVSNWTSGPDGRL